MKKKWAWSLVLVLLVLDGFTGFPDSQKIFVTTHYPPNYVAGDSPVTTTIRRGIPFIWTSGEVSIGQSSTSTDAGWHE